MTSAATARAHANIALVKYWGKRDRALNLPAAGSLSLTLDALATTTTVSFGGDRDRFWLGGAEVSGAALERLSRWLDLVRERAGIDDRAEVRSDNNFPTASGLASSASAYAALAVAASAAAGLELEPRELSILARRGSGSAARSIFGGLVAMRAGSSADGSDAYAEPIAAFDGFVARLAMVIGIVGGGATKSISSRDAMEHCAATSPLYPCWLESVPPDLAAARGALERGDFDGLGEICEGSALAMHAAAIASRPSINYWRPATLRLMDAVRGLRHHKNVAAFFTIDAGPHVKVLTTREAVDDVASMIAEVDGVTSVLRCYPGPGAQVVGA